MAPPFDGRSSAGSLWRDDARAPRYQPLTGRHRADVAIVGAGITGLTLAYLLKQQGATVLVLERDTVGAGTTGRSTAKATVLHGAIYHRLAELHGNGVASAYATANQVGLDLISELAEELGGPDVVERRAAMSYATDSNGRATVERETEAARHAGLAVDLVHDPSFGIPSVAGVRIGEQAQIDAQAYLDALAAAIDGDDCAVHERSAMAALPGWSGRSVATEDGRVEADWVVLATGIPPTYRGLYFSRAEPVRSYVVALRVADMPADEMVISVDEPLRSMRTVPGDESGERLLLVGGEGHVTGRHGRAQGATERLVAWADRNFGVREVVRQWSAQDYRSVDHLPFVGSLWPFAGQCQVATGFGKWGLTNGAAAAVALSRVIEGAGAPPWAEPFDPARLGGPRSLGRLATLNGSVARRLAVDWSRTVASAMPGAGEVEAVTEGEGQVVGSLHGPIAVSRVGGAERRLSAVCPHLGGVVQWNDLEQSWDCPLHGSRFAADGALLEGPTTESLKRLDDGLN